MFGLACALLLLFEHEPPVQPVAVQPGAVQSGAVQPGAVQPVAVQRGAVQSGAPASATETSATTPVASASSGLSFGPNATAELRVLDTSGNTVVTLSLRPMQTVTVDLPPGTYVIVDEGGTEIDRVELGWGQRVEVGLPAAAESEPSPPPAPVTPTRPTTTAPPRAEPASTRPPWHRWAAPLLSAVIPGTGQMLNRQPGKGVSILLGTAALIGGALGARWVRDPKEGAGGNDDDRVGAGREIARLASMGVFTGALILVYPAQIMDARAVAVGAPIRPRHRYKIAFELSRSSTVAFRPGQPSHALYHDWTLSVLGQPVRRLSLGLSDVGFKIRSARARNTFQAGLRVRYRVFDRARFWLAVAVGGVLQGTVAAGQPPPLDRDQPLVDDEAMFGGFVYAQLEGKIFLLDRWSLLVAPRLTVPLTTRFYSFDRSLPRYAPTLELGTGVGVHF